MPAGFGTADWPALFQALRRDDYHGFVSLEPHLLRAGPAGGSTGPTSLQKHTGPSRRSSPRTACARCVRGAKEPPCPHRSHPRTIRRRATRHGRLAAGGRRAGHSLPASTDASPRRTRLSCRRRMRISCVETAPSRCCGCTEDARPADRHMDRFARTCESSLLDFPRDQILADLAALLEEAGPVDCLWRVLVARDGTRLHLLEWSP